MGRAAADAEQGRVLCARIVDHGWDASIAVVDGDACLSVRIDASHWHGVEVVGGVARARAVSAPFDQVLGEAPAAAGDGLAIRVRPSAPALGESAGPDVVGLGLERDGAFVALAEVDGRHLSTELAGGFTGRMLGLEALGGPARVSEVRYLPGLA